MIDNLDARIKSDCVACMSARPFARGPLFIQQNLIEILLYKEGLAFHPVTKRFRVLLPGEKRKRPRRRGRATRKRPYQ